MKKLILCVVSIYITACTATGPSVEVTPPSINTHGVIEYDDGHKHKKHKSKGCPPGLAKQGRC